MPDDNDFGGFAPPPFKPDDALVALKRKLRDLKLTDRGGKEYLLGARSVVQLTVDGSTIVAKLAKRPALTPEWTAHTLKSAADVRKFTDTLQQQLKRWGDED
jgi:hypothetical protein